MGVRFRLWCSYRLTELEYRQEIAGHIRQDQTSELMDHLTKPKEQCPRCLRWHAPSVLKYKTHKCIPPTLDGETLVDKKASEDATKEGCRGEEEVPVPPPEEAVLDTEEPPSRSCGSGKGNQG